MIAAMATETENAPSTDGPHSQIGASRSLLTTTRSSSFFLGKKTAKKKQAHNPKHKEREEDGVCCWFGVDRWRVFRGAVLWFWWERGMIFVSLPDSARWILVTLVG